MIYFLTCQVVYFPAFLLAGATAYLQLLSWPCAG
jgi:hypothetical protein